MPRRAPARDSACSSVPPCRAKCWTAICSGTAGARSQAPSTISWVIRANEGGTLFLDEIGEGSLDLQVKLLRS